MTRGVSRERPASPARWPRAWLFTPADDEHKLAAAERSPAEAVIADLEDAVSEERKDEARAAAAAFAARRGGMPRVVRINDPRTPHGRADLEVLRSTPPLAVMVPKAEAETLRSAHEAGLRTIALVETARGVTELEQLAALPGVMAIALGVVDLAVELGLGALEDGLELLHVRSRAVLASALGPVPALDGPFVMVADDRGLEEESRRSRALGFAGKLCIHPRQLPIVSDAFAPSRSELDWARGVLAAYERALRHGRGAALARGEMIDLASVRRAQRMIGESRS